MPLPTSDLVAAVCETLKCRQYSRLSNICLEGSERRYCGRCRAEVTSQATPILMAYKAIIGAAKRHMFRMSEVGVTIAATTKIASTAYRRLRHIQRAVITRIRARKKTRTGISK